MNKLKMVVCVIFLILFSLINAKDIVKLKYLFTVPIVGEDQYYSIFLDSKNNSYVFLVKDQSFVDGSAKIIPFQTIKVNLSLIKTKDNVNERMIIQNPYKPNDPNNHYNDKSFDLKIVFETDKIYINNFSLYKDGE